MTRLLGNRRADDMHISQNKALVQLFFILVFTTVGTLLFFATDNGPYRRYRFSGYDLADLHQVALARNISLPEKEHPLNNSKHKVNEQKAETKTFHPFFKTAPNNPEMSFRIDPKFNFSSCSYSLQGKLQESQWASQYYHPAIQMTMTSANINQTEYERLKKYHMPYGFYYRRKLTFGELSKTLKLFSSEESVIDFDSNKRPPCVSCAVVGNGGILNGSGLGKEIDNHDMVFRVNHCIRRGHENDVGNRTTHYVFMHRSLMHTQQSDIPTDKGIKWVFLPCEISDFHYIAEVARGNNPKQKLKAKAANIRLLHPDFVRYIQKVWMRTKSFRPSTGAMMLWTALHAGCDSLSVYGMGFNAKYTGYYYDKTFHAYRNLTASHDFARELKILKELHKAGVIQWYRRDVPEFLL